MGQQDIDHEAGAYVGMSAARLLVIERRNLARVCDSLQALITAGDSGLLDQWVRARNTALVMLSMYEPREDVQGPPE